ncbi:MAG: M48 family metallopeptidase [Pseudomonadota bacterium]
MTTTNPNKARPDRARIARSAALLLALWLGFWILALALVAGLLWVAFSQLSHGKPDIAGGAALVVAAMLLYALRPRKRQAMRVPLPLLRENAPALYAQVEQIGKALGIKAKVSIHLANAATATISHRTGWNGKVKSLEVGVGLPLLVTLSEDELGSMIAHEFGHFVAGGRLGPWVYRTRESIANSALDLGDSLFFVDLLYALFGRAFVRLSAGVARAQEFEADALAASKFGRTVSCNALKKVNMVAPMWAAYVVHELYPAVGRGARMPVFDGFRRFCRAGVRRAEVEAAIRDAEQGAKSAFDVHPTLEERIEAIKPGARAGAPPLAECTHLLGGEAEAEHAWYDFFHDGQLEKCSWERFGADVVQPQVRQRFAGSWMDPERLPLGDLIVMAEEPMEMWDRLKPEGISFLSRGAKRKHVVDIIEEWVIAGLDQRGFTIAVAPGQPLRMERDGQTVLPSELMAAALGRTLKPAALAALTTPTAPKVNLQK